MCNPKGQTRVWFIAISRPPYYSFEKLYQKLHSAFHPISRHLEVGLKKLGRASFFKLVFPLETYYTRFPEVLLGKM